MEKETTKASNFDLLFGMFTLALLWIGIPVLIIMSMVAFPMFWVILLLLLLVLK